VRCFFTASLIEKARTVPDSYPLTLNLSVLGYNQKSSRDSFMELTEANVVSALNKLKSIGLVRKTSGGHSIRFEHNFQRAWACLNKPLCCWVC
jgi:uncharacterized protein